MGRGLEKPGSGSGAGPGSRSRSGSRSGESVRPEGAQDNSRG